MRPIDADRLLTERMKSKYYHLPNGDIAIPIIDIEHAPTIEPKQDEWIPCSERLPETKSVDDWVKALVCSADGGIAVGSFNSEYGWTFSHYFDAVVAWMPLPPAYEGE